METVKSYQALTPNKQKLLLRSSSGNLVTQAYMGSARLLLEQGKISEAQSYYDELRSMRPDMPAVMPQSAKDADIKSWSRGALKGHKTLNLKDPEKLISEAVEFIQTPGITGEEGQVGGKIKARLEALKEKGMIDNIEIDAAGNVIAKRIKRKGNLEVLFAAHMDTVEKAEFEGERSVNPLHQQLGPQAQLGGDGKIRSDGSTVLGADNRAAIAAAFSALDALQGSDVNVTLVFTVREENVGPENKAHPAGRGVYHVNQHVFENIDYVLQLDTPQKYYEKDYTNGGVIYGDAKVQQGLLDLIQNSAVKVGIANPSHFEIDAIQHGKEINESHIWSDQFRSWWPEGREGKPGYPVVVNLEGAYADEHTHQESLDAVRLVQQTDLLVQIVKDLAQTKAGMTSPAQQRHETAVRSIEEMSPEESRRALQDLFEKSGVSLADWGIEGDEIPESVEVGQQIGEGIHAKVYAVKGLRLPKGVVIKEVEKGQEVTVRRAHDDVVVKKGLQPGEVLSYGQPVVSSINGRLYIIQVKGETVVNKMESLIRNGSVAQAEGVLVAAIEHIKRLAQDYQVKYIKTANPQAVSTGNILDDMVVDDGNRVINLDFANLENMEVKDVTSYLRDVLGRVDQNIDSLNINGAFKMQLHGVVENEKTKLEETAQPTATPALGEAGKAVIGPEVFLEVPSETTDAAGKAHRVALVHAIGSSFHGGWDSDRAEWVATRDIAGLLTTNGGKVNFLSFTLLVEGYPVGTYGSYGFLIDHKAEGVRVNHVSPGDSMSGTNFEGGKPALGASNDDQMTAVKLIEKIKQEYSRRGYSQMNELNVSFDNIGKAINGIWYRERNENGPLEVFTILKALSRNGIRNIEVFKLKDDGNFEPVVLTRQMVLDSMDTVYKEFDETRFNGQLSSDINAFFDSVQTAQSLGTLPRLEEGLAKESFNMAGQGLLGTQTLAGTMMVEADRSQLLEGVINQLSQHVSGPALEQMTQSLQTLVSQPSADNTKMATEFFAAVRNSSLPSSLQQQIFQLCDWGCGSCAIQEYNRVATLKFSNAPEYAAAHVPLADQITWMESIGASITDIQPAELDRFNSLSFVMNDLASRVEALMDKEAKEGALLKLEIMKRLIMDGRYLTSLEADPALKGKISTLAVGVLKEQTVVDILAEAIKEAQRMLVQRRAEDKSLAAIFRDMNVMDFSFFDGVLILNLPDNVNAFAHTADDGKKLIVLNAKLFGAFLGKPVKEITADEKLSVIFKIAKTYLHESGHFWLSHTGVVEKLWRESPELALFMEEAVVRMLAQDEAMDLESILSETVERINAVHGDGKAFAEKIFRMMNDQITFVFDQQAEEIKSVFEKQRLKFDLRVNKGEKPEVFVNRMRRNAKDANRTIVYVSKNKVQIMGDKGTFVVSYEEGIQKELVALAAFGVGVNGHAFIGGITDNYTSNTLHISKSLLQLVTGMVANMATEQELSSSA